MMMNELEFQEKVLANPDTLDPDVLEAIRENPALATLLAELQSWTSQVDATLRGIEAPANLQAKLLSIPEAAFESSEPDSIAEQPAEVVSLDSRRSAGTAQYYAIAASLLLAFGIGFSTLFSSNPSESDLAFGNEVLAHLYHDGETFDSLETDGQLGFQLVNSVMAPTGNVLLDETLLSRTVIKMAKPCFIIPSYESAHLVMKGSKGAVSLFVVNNSPVEAEFEIHDDRFDGVVIPSDQGNIILVGEHLEDLDRYKALFSGAMEWSI